MEGMGWAEVWTWRRPQWALDDVGQMRIAGRASGGSGAQEGARPALARGAGGRRAADDHRAPASLDRTLARCWASPSPLPVLPSLLLSLPSLSEHPRPRPLPHPLPRPCTPGSSPSSAVPLPPRPTSSPHPSPSSAATPSVPTTSPTTTPSSTLPLPRITCLVPSLIPPIPPPRPLPPTRCALSLRAPLSRQPISPRPSTPPQTSSSTLPPHPRPQIPSQMPLPASHTQRQT